MSPSPALRCALVLLTLALAGPAWAGHIDGFGDLKWGMTPDQVRAAYPGRIVHDPDTKGAPDGTVGGRLVLTGGSTLFDQPVEVSAYFGKGGLSIVRLLFTRPADGNIQRVLDWHVPHFGEPVVTTEKLAHGATKREWTWPWEGMELREVKEDGRIKYQRVDFSDPVREAWMQADTAICSILPSTSKCPFPDRFCPQQDASMASGRREQSFPIAGSEGKLTCSYQDYARSDVRLVLEKPDTAAAEWLLRDLDRRLGAGQEKQRQDANSVLLDTEWAEHAVTLRVVRKARSKTKSGNWTGPVEYMRLRRTDGTTAAEGD